MHAAPLVFAGNTTCQRACYEPYIVPFYPQCSANAIAAMDVSMDKLKGMPDIEAASTSTVNGGQAEARVRMREHKWDNARKRGDVEESTKHRGWCLASAKKPRPY